MNRLNAEYWTERYEEGQTGWDIGEASPPLIEFCDILPREKSILIPGAGNAYEWSALKDKGFNTVHIVDLSPHPIEKLKSRYKENSSDFILGDFFDLKGRYDIILEQTFFCALDPILRPRYVEKMNEILKENGILAGVLFNRIFEHQGPPFGGNEKDYRALFDKGLNIIKMEECYNSIAPRKESELFFIATAK